MYFFSFFSFFLFMSFFQFYSIDPLPRYVLALSLYVVFCYIFLIIVPFIPSLFYLYFPLYPYSLYFTKNSLDHPCYTTRPTTYSYTIYLCGVSLSPFMFHNVFLMIPIDVLVYPITLLTQVFYGGLTRHTIALRTAISSST